ncbi:CTD kinase subunit gamma CTK3-domain-containing protein [Melampsora americana]|nr:CTD kinase subunit gamma CTK3-domain-containing protein [Melampsora americana]
MDGFEVRLQLVSILRKLSSSQNSIQTTIRFLLKHRSKCGEDLWDCLVEECQNASLNARINILYLVDSLLITTSTTYSSSHTTSNSSNKKNQETKSNKPFQSSNHTTQDHSNNYGQMIKKDLKKLIELIVPIEFQKKGLLNLMSTQQVLKNWKNQINLINKFIDLNEIEEIENLLSERKTILANAPVDTRHLDNDFLDFSKRDILDRIDDDRERHKRLRERIWVLPIPPTSSLSIRPGPSNKPYSSYPTHRLATLLYTSLKASASDKRLLTNEKPCSPANRSHLASSSTSSTTSPEDDRSPIRSPAQFSSSRPTTLNRPNPSLHNLSYKECDLSIQLECDQMISANVEDTGEAGLESSDWEAMKIEHQRCYGLRTSSSHTPPDSPNIDI